MNYAGFKKVKEDEHKAILKNKHGHELTISKKALSPKHLKGLNELPLYAAEGTGPVVDPNDGEAIKAHDAAIDARDAEAEQNRAANQPKKLINNVPGTDAAHPNHEKAPVQIFVGGQGAPSQEDRSPSVAPDAPPPGLAEPQQQPEDLSPDAAPQNSAPVPMAMPQQAPAPGPSSAPATPEQHKALQMQQYTTEDKATENDLNNGHIQAKTYSDLLWKDKDGKDKSTLGKIGTLFGLLMSGAGAGLTHQPNLLFQMMDKEIQNDLEAQSKSKLNAQNLLRINQNHQLQQAQIPKLMAEGKLTNAQAKVATQDALMKGYALSNMQYNRFSFHAMVQNMQKFPPGSPERQKAEQALGLLYNTVNNENFSIADRATSASALLNFGQQSNGTSPENAFQQRNTALRISGNAPLAVDAESKHFPGLKGQASAPLSGEEKGQIDNGIKFDRQLSDFIDWTKNHSGKLNPVDIKTGLAKAALVQGGFRKATDGGVYKEGEQNFIGKIIDSDPTKFFNALRVLPQLGAVSQDVRTQLDQRVKDLGFSGYNSSFKSQKTKSSSSSGSTQEGATGSHNGKPVVFKNGKWSYR